MGYSRTMPQYVKDKISRKLQGRKLSDKTKQLISTGVKSAWNKIPSPQSGTTTYNCIK